MISYYYLLLLFLCCSVTAFAFRIFPFSLPHSYGGISSALPEHLPGRNNRNLYINKYNNNNNNGGSDQIQYSRSLKSTESSSDSDSSVGAVGIPRPKRSTPEIVFRWITGLTLGGVASLWIASGKFLFAAGFLGVTLITQSEFDNILRQKGIETATTFSRLAMLVFYISAALSPSLHEASVSMLVLAITTYFLLARDRSSSINEFSTTLFGSFYLAYTPSFWVRLSGLESLEKLVSLRAVFGGRLANNFFLRRGLWTPGAAVMWFTWLSIVCGDVGAYFFGKSMGRHKLSAVSLAAGASSPNKTVEGALGGFLSCALCMTLGAYAMRWPAWRVTGPLYGLLLGVTGMVGDLAESMFKRDAGLKDAGTLLPGHGGLLDRIDSYLLTAPVAFFFCKYALPVFARAVGRSGSPMGAVI